MSADDRPHWTESADRVWGSERLWGPLAEDDYGRILVPSLLYPGIWSREFRWWRPTHWPAWLRSRLTNELAWVEQC